MTEALTKTAPLTSEDVAFVTERCLDSYTNRFNERLIEEARDEAEALRSVLRYNSVWGSCCGDYILEGRGNRIRFRRDGREGVVTWMQIIRSVRACLAAATEGTQLSLFPDCTP